MGDGSTLVAVSDYATTKLVGLYSIGRDCAPDRGFGNEGAATITISSRSQPVRPVSGGESLFGLWVNAVAPRKGGGAILAGGYGNDWVVGAITRRGEVDPSFGNNGWTVLPFVGQAAAVVQERSGRILVGGDNNGGGCCTRNWLAAVSARGHLESGFGSGEREELPTGEDSGIETLAREPNGDILVGVRYGLMGCWGEGVAMLTPRGRPVPLFAKRLGHFWRRLAFNAFAGDVYVDGAGFALVGTGQKPCLSHTSFSAPSATGLIARFHADGEPVGRTIRFSTLREEGVQAFDDSPDALLVQSPFLGSTPVTLTTRRPDGSIDPGFADDGRARIHAPWQGLNAAYETSFTLVKAGPHALVLIATRDGQRKLRITRVRLNSLGPR